jgi:uncharacterized protein
MDQMSLTILRLVTLAVMMTGLMAVFFLPGLLIIWLAALVYGLITGFTLTSGIIFGSMTVLMLTGSVMDNIIVGKAARNKGTSWRSILLALAAGLLGSLFLSPLGGVILSVMFFVGSEWLRLKKFKEVLLVIRQMLAGYGWSLLMTLGIGVVMIILWGIWVWQS